MILLKNNYSAYNDDNDDGDRDNEWGGIVVECETAGAAMAADGRDLDDN